MRREIIAWGIIVLSAIVIVSSASCVVGYISSGQLRARTPTPTMALRPPVIREIQRVAELATVKHTLSAELTGVHTPDDLRARFGIREEILLIAYGEVAAGFDLSKLSEEDVWTDGTRIQLHLPAPEILYTRLDNERTHVVYYSRSWLVGRDLGLEGRARLDAERAILQAAMEARVLEQAGEYGRLFFANWLYSLGFTEVQVVVN